MSRHTLPESPEGVPFESSRRRLRQREGQPYASTSPIAAGPHLSQTRCRGGLVASRQSCGCGSETAAELQARLDIAPGATTNQRHLVMSRHTFHKFCRGTLAAQAYEPNGHP